MASTCVTLSTDFLSGLDWRPLHFEHPLPSDRECQLCGVVCKETAVLPCFHTLCNVCFEGSVALGCACPLDREVFDQDGVDKLRLRPGQLLRLRVRCWNDARGCDFVGPISELLDHFEKNCAHHQASCPRCHQDMPRLGLVRHYVHECDTTTSVEEPQPDTTNRGQFLEDLERASTEIKQSIAELKDGFYGLQTSVNRMAHDVKRGRSEGRQALTEGMSSLLAQLQTSQTDVTSQRERLLRDLGKASDEIKQSITELKNVSKDVKLGSSEAKKSLAEALSRLLAHLQTAQPDVTSQGRRLLEELQTACVEITQSIAELKD
ncbi:unnamed protein product, partial [Ixodes hexagonus]